MIARRLLPALMIALLLSGILTFWLSRRLARPATAAKVPSRYVVAITKNMQAGEQVQPAFLHLVDWPASQSIRGTFSKSEDVAGRVLLFPVAEGELILDQNLAALGSATGLTVKIPEGMRAISLRSDEIAGVAGFMLPGSFVDVLVTYHSANTPDFSTVTVLQDVRILALGQKLEPDPDGKANPADAVTLLVTPQDAEKMALANSLGKIHFVLRNDTDRKQVSGLLPQLSLAEGKVGRSPIKSARLRGQKVLQIPLARYTVQTIAGSKQTEETFEGQAQ